MIFTRYGCPIEIVGYCGKHKAKGLAGPCVLVKTRCIDDGAERYRFAFTLKADGGYQEIEQAVDAATEIGMNKVELATAIAQAV